MIQDTGLRNRKFKNQQLYKQRLATTKYSRFIAVSNGPSAMPTPTRRSEWVPLCPGDWQQTARSTFENSVALHQTKSICLKTIKLYSKLKGFYLKWNHDNRPYHCLHTIKHYDKLQKFLNTVRLTTNSQASVWKLSGHSPGRGTGEGGGTESKDRDSGSVAVRGDFDTHTPQSATVVWYGAALWLRV